MRHAFMSADARSQRVRQSKGEGRTNPDKPGPPTSVDGHRAYAHLCAPMHDYCKRNISAEHAQDKRALPQPPRHGMYVVGPIKERAYAWV